MKQRTILIVDDEGADREGMCRALERQGYTVVQSKNYWDALRTYEQYPGRVDMLVTAIALPGNNGYELARALSGVDPTLKVLFVSGPTGAEVSRFYNMPVTGSHLINRPIQAAELVRRVGSAFRSRVHRLRVQSAT